MLKDDCISIFMCFFYVDYVFNLFRKLSLYNLFLFMIINRYQDLLIFTKMELSPTHPPQKKRREKKRKGLYLLFLSCCRWILWFHMLKPHLVHLSSNAQLLVASIQSSATLSAASQRYKDFPDVVIDTLLFFIHEIKS